MPPGLDRVKEFVLSYLEEPPLSFLDVVLLHHKWGAKGADFY